MDRDLKADQEICAHFNKLVKQGVYEEGSPTSHELAREIFKFALVANEGWPYALNKLAEIQGGENVEIKDSGERRTFSTGSVRDVSEGKGRCDLLPLGVIGVFLSDEVLLKIENYIRQGNVDDLFWVLGHIGRTYYKSPYCMFLEVAKQYEDGAKKYAERNWEKGQPLHVYIDSGVRHYLKFKAGLTDEPHLRAFVWNILGAIWTHRNKPELIDLPFKDGENA